MHIVEAGRSGADHLHTCKKRTPVSALLRKPVLYRHHPLEKPLIKIDVVGIVPKYGHVSVRMQIDESGHDKVVRCINDLKFFFLHILRKVLIHFAINYKKVFRQRIQFFRI